MKVDVSEIKSFKSCPRKWKLSSRNGYHLRTRVTPPQFAMGTLFHESLHALYLGGSLDSVMKTVRKEMSGNGDEALLAMIPGYAKNVLPGDLDKYVVLDIEHKFNINALNLMYHLTGRVDTRLKDIWFVGSVDMIVYCPEDNKIYGFEHKTCKDFRPASYLWLDEQPRLYDIALKEYVDEWNRKQLENWEKQHRMRDLTEEIKPPKPIPAEVGGVFLNEVRKLLRQFQYSRTLCTYEKSDLINFMTRMCEKALEIQDMASSGRFACPEPDYFKCKMCDFKDACETYMYSDIPKALLLDDFKDQFVERETDHLDEKVERVKEDPDDGLE